MFIEPNINNARRGWIEVICGSMFSGKTEELIRRLKRAKIANLKVEIFKPEMDTRYDSKSIISHDENTLFSKPVRSSRAIIDHFGSADVVGIDEAQFFDEELPDICDQLAIKGARVIVAGLDMDYACMPFGPVPKLLAKADYLTKLHAICARCGNIANYSYRKTNQESQILLGEKDIYEPRCRACYAKGDLA
ncbi:MAG TPA: thymidine kinase [Puia sp.]|nr:thymidine kinase [Puia sp.]